MMMHIQYDPHLVEAAVNWAVRSHPALEQKLRQALDPLYAEFAPDERDEPFNRSYRDWFVRLGLDQVVTGWIAEFPIISANVDGVVVRIAAKVRLQSAELFVRQRDDEPGVLRTLILQVCPESLCAPQQFRDTMMRELMHVADMLDPRFGYELPVIDQPRAREQLIKDRYRVLWDIWVEKRLFATGRVALCSTRRLKGLLERAFSGQQGTEDLLARVWNAERICHVDLMQLAQNPEAEIESLEYFAAVDAHV